MTVSNITEQSGRIVVALTGEIDMENAPQVRRALLDNLKQKRDVLVDLSQVTYIDSSGIASLIEGLQAARKQMAGQTLRRDAVRLVAAPDRLRHHERPAAQRRGHHVERREAEHPADRRHLVGDGARPLVPCVENLGRPLVPEEQDAGVHRLDRVEGELERHADAEQAREAGGRLRAHEYGWAVFTSENAVDTTFELLEAERVDARAFAGVRLCAVGTATAEALRRHGLLADLLPAEADGDGVLRALLEEGIAGQRVLLPRAEGARAALPDGLRAAGATVDELALYLAAPPAAPSPRTLERVRRGEVDVVTFTSSSTVSNLATLLEGDLEPVRSAIVACIGPQTAATARDVGLDPTVVASDRSVEGLVQALLEHFGGDTDPEFAE
mgnify:CR=1 FL=1